MPRLTYRAVLDHPPDAVFAFVADAYAHCKFIAYTADARPLVERALAGSPLDGGCKQVETGIAAAQFASQCAQLRFFAREPVLGL